MASTELPGNSAVLSPLELIKRFFGPLNAYAYDPSRSAVDISDENILAVEESLRHYVIGRHEFPVLLPCRAVGADQTSWYACSHTVGGARRLHSELRAFIGPSYADFPIDISDCNDPNQIASLLNESFGDGWFAFSSNPRNGDAAIRAAWTRYWSLLQIRPSISTDVPATFDQLRARFERAAIAKDETAARTALASMRERFTLSSENELFLEVRLLASLEQWPQILEHRLFRMLTVIKLPPEVYGDLVEAVYQTSVAIYENSNSLELVLQAVRDGIFRPIYPLLRTRRESTRLSVLKTVVLTELTSLSPAANYVKDICSQIPVGAFNKLDESVRQQVESLQRGASIADGLRALDEESFDRAFSILWEATDTPDVLSALIRCAKEIEDPARANQVIDRLNRACIAVRETAISKVPRSYEKLASLADSASLKDAACAPLIWNQSARESAAHYVARVRMSARDSDVATLLEDPNFDDAFTDALLDLSIAHPGVFELVFPYFIELFVTRTAPTARLLPVYCMLLEAKGAQGSYGDAELTLLRALIEKLLSAGPDVSAYSSVMVRLQDILTDIYSPQRVGWSLGVIDLLQTSPCQNEALRLSVTVKAFDMAQSFATRITATERAFARILAHEINVKLELRESETSNNRNITERYDGHTVVLYSLDERAARRARNVLQSAYAGLIVETVSDMVSSDRLKSAARRADVFVFQWKSSTHPAYYCIKENISADAALIHATGSGASSLIFAANDSLMQRM